jgi:dolichol-phosphate mannosyltransferase
VNNPDRQRLSLLRPLADAAACLAALHAGCAYGLAHLMGFGFGWLIAALVAALPIPGAGASRMGAPAMTRAGLNLLALLLRGGVLTLLIERVHLPAPWAIVAAVLVSTLILRRGAQLLAPRPQGADGVQWRALAVALGLYAVLLRLAYMGSVDLFPEEAYYWNYAQHLDFGYLDHPPMVAWLIRAGTVVFGNVEFGVRIGALLCMGVASFFVYRSAEELYGRGSALVAAVLMQVLPAFFLAGLFMTPDTPLVAAWAAALYFLQRALLQDHGRAWWGAGVALGLGLISKYTIALLVPATLVFLLCDRPSRRWLMRPLPYAAGVLTLVIFSPVILWNARHEWASFAFQTSQRLAEAPHFSLHRLILAALALLTPIGAAALPYLLRSGAAGAAAAGAPDADDTPEARRLRFLRVYTLVPLSVFVLFSLRHTIKLDWTGGMWVAIVPALAQAIAARGAAAVPPWLRRCWGATAMVVLVGYGATLHYLTLGPPGVPYSRQLQALPVAWSDLGRQVDGEAAQLRAAGAAQPLVVGMNRYMLASELAFYARDPVQAAQNTASQNLFGPSGLMYEQWFPAHLQEGRTLLLVALDARELDDARLAPQVESLGPVRAGELRRNGHIVAQYFYRTAFGYRSAARSE